MTVVGVDERMGVVVVMPMVLLLRLVRIVDVRWRTRDAKSLVMKRRMRAGCCWSSLRVDDTGGVPVDSVDSPCPIKYSRSCLLPLQPHCPLQIILVVVVDHSSSSDADVFGIVRIALAGTEWHRMTTTTTSAIPFEKCVA